MPVGVHTFEVFKQPGTQPLGGIRGCHCQVEPNHRMRLGLPNGVLNGGSPEQLLPFSCIGTKDNLVGTPPPWQIALEEGCQGGDQQGFAETARSGQEDVLRLQPGTVAADGSQQSAQVVGLVDVQAAAPGESG